MDVFQILQQPLQALGACHLAQHLLLDACAAK
jgi:hypothetical protein